MNFTPKHFTHSVGVGAQQLRNVVILRATLSQNVRSHSLIKTEGLALNRYWVQLYTRDRVAESCHGNNPPLASLGKGGETSLPVVPAVALRGIACRAPSVNRLPGISDMFDPIRKRVNV